MQKSLQSVKANNTKAQGTGAENGTNLQRLSAVAQATEVIGAVNKPLGTLTNIMRPMQNLFCEGLRSPTPTF